MKIFLFCFIFLQTLALRIINEPNNLKKGNFLLKRYLFKKLKDISKSKNRKLTDFDNISKQEKKLYDTIDNIKYGTKTENIITKEKVEFAKNEVHSDIENFQKNGNVQGQNEKKINLMEMYFNNKDNIMVENVNKQNYEDLNSDKSTNETIIDIHSQLVNNNEKDVSSLENKISNLENKIKMNQIKNFVADKKNKESETNLKGNIGNLINDKKIVDYNIDLHNENSNKINTNKKNDKNTNEIENLINNKKVIDNNLSFQDENLKDISYNDKDLKVSDLMQNLLEKNHEENEIINKQENHENQIIDQNQNKNIIIDKEENHENKIIDNNQNKIINKLETQIIGQNHNENMIIDKNHNENMIIDKNHNENQIIDKDHPFKFENLENSDKTENLIDINNNYDKLKNDNFVNLVKEDEKNFHVSEINFEDDLNQKRNFLNIKEKNENEINENLIKSLPNDNLMIIPSGLNEIKNDKINIDKNENDPNQIENQNINKNFTTDFFYNLPNGEKVEKKETKYIDPKTHYEFEKTEIIKTYENPKNSDNSHEESFEEKNGNLSDENIWDDFYENQHNIDERIYTNLLREGMLLDKSTVSLFNICVILMLNFV